MPCLTDFVSGRRIEDENIKEFGSRFLGGPFEKREYLSNVTKFSKIC